VAGRGWARIAPAVASGDPRGYYVADGAAHIDPGERSIMLMRRLGRTGLRVAALCLGGNTFG